MKKKTSWGILFLVSASALLISCSTTPDPKEKQTQEGVPSLEKIDLPVYKVGERWEWRWMRGRGGDSWSHRVIEVKENQIVATTGFGHKLFLDKQYNLIIAITPKADDVTQDFWWEKWFWYKIFPLQVGRKWEQTQRGIFYSEGKKVEQEFQITYEVEGVEDVDTPAGIFPAAKILTTLITEDKVKKEKIHLRVYLWYSPKAKNYVMGEWENSSQWVPEWQGVLFKLSKFEPGK